MSFSRFWLALLGVVVLCCAFVFVSGPLQALVLVVALVLMLSGLVGSFHL